MQTDSHNRSILWEHATSTGDVKEHHACVTHRRTAPAIFRPDQACFTLPFELGPAREHWLRVNEALSRRSVRRRLIVITLLAAAVLTLLLAVPALRPVIHDVGQTDVWWLVLAAALEVASCVSFVVVFRMFFDTVPTVPAHELAWTEMASGALLPGGGVGSLAVGGWLLHQAGMPTRRIVVRSSGLFFYTSATSVAALVGAGVLLLTGVSGGHGGILRTGLPIAAGVIVTLAAISVPVLVARRSRRSLRGEWLRDTAEGITEAEHFIVHPTWRAVGALGYLGFDIAVLWATLGAVGYHPPIATLLLGYIIGYMANLLPVPGGVGVLEGGLAGTLILYGAPASPAAAGVLIYHAIAFWVPAAGGLLGYALLRQRLQKYVTGPAGLPGRERADVPALDRAGARTTRTARTARTTRGASSAPMSAHPASERRPG